MGSLRVTWGLRSMVLMGGCWCTRYISYENAQHQGSHEPCVTLKTKHFPIDLICEIQ
jgi:hypothetical protein